ncbi:MAG: hypothetical protein L3J47_09490 [Sulfurovum sp.]|nr:hypothetical protein [Sulfurovum sp.]
MCDLICFDFFDAFDADVFDVDVFDIKWTIFGREAAFEIAECSIAFDFAKIWRR